MLTCVIPNDGIGTRVLGPNRYFLLRIEDIALGDPMPTISRLAKFLDPKDPTGYNVEKAMEICTGHAKSYGGNKLSKENRTILMQRMHIGEDTTVSQKVTSALDLFGYKLDDWGIAKPAPIVGE